MSAPASAERSEEPPPTKPKPPADEEKPSADEESFEPEELISVLGNSTRTNNGQIFANFGTMRVGSVSEELPLVDGPVSDQMMRDAAEAFEHPQEFGAAKEVLDGNGLVLLCGNGTGRTMTAVRLLMQSHASSLQHLNPERSVLDLASGILDERAGYLWQGQLPGWERQLSGGRLVRLARVLGRVRARLVVVADHATDLPDEALHYTVTLSPPDPIQVVRRHLLRMVPAESVADLEIEARKLLHVGASPGEAVKVAVFLKSLRERDYRPERTIAELRDRTDNEVQSWFANPQSLAARALMIAVAVFEHRSCAEVVQAALQLEPLLANPEHEDIWPYMPPDLFVDTRATRLGGVHAATVPNPNRGVSGDDPEIVRFDRPGWAEAVLRCIWCQYDRLRPTIKEWLGNRPTHGQAHKAGAVVIGRLLGGTPGPDPTAELTTWAGSTLARQREMAAAAIGGMAEQPELIPLVRKRLRSWSLEEAGIARRLTAALAYGGTFGQRHPRLAVERLGVLAERADDLLRNAVIRGITGLAEEPANRPEVLRNLVVWTQQTDSWRLRDVALRSSLCVLGLAWPTRRDYDRYRKDLAAAEADGEQLSVLVGNLFGERRTAGGIVPSLQVWANRAELDPSLAPSLVTLLRILFGQAQLPVVERLTFEIRHFLHTEEESATALRTFVAQALEQVR